MTTNWTYNGQEISCLEDLPDYEKYVGFVYKITDRETGKFYIGKKAFTASEKRKIGVREKSLTKTRKTFKRVTKESDWKKYYGSSKTLKADVKTYGPERFERVIVKLCCTKKYLSYCELANQILNDCLRNNSYNENILGRYYARDMQNCNTDVRTKETETRDAAPGRKDAGRREVLL
jgi:hypothetical protein